MTTVPFDRRKFLSVALGSVVAGLAGPVFGQTDKRFIPPRAIGVNCFDLFYGPLMGHASARMPITRLRELRMAGIPFVRFAASPFWPNEWELYFTDRSRYFSFLDAVVEAAEVNDIGLVPSLFWNPVTVSDLVGEPASDWGREGSATRAFATDYVEQVVSRYHQSSALWMWEFGNEFNTFADLPNSLNWWPKVAATKGTPFSRTSKDIISGKVCSSAFKLFASEVKKLDPVHLISTGADLPRPNAYSLSVGKWKADSRAEFRSALLEITPSPMDVISIHLYQKADRAFFQPAPASYSELLSEIAAAGVQGNKLTFVGEFGVPRLPNKKKERSEFERLLGAIISSKVYFAAMWVYDFGAQKNDWSVNLNGDRAYQLELIASANNNL